jgi:hypothetical protein
MALLIGCSGDPALVCHPVTGQVTFDGKPVAEAMVVFHPLESIAGAAARPIAYTDASGAFALTTNESRDGALPGEYAITVELRAPRQVGEEIVRDGRNILPAKYSQPTTSGLKFTVNAGENRVPEIKLAR